jgi:hypothetical protein
LVREREREKKAGRVGERRGEGAPTGVRGEKRERGG